VNNSFERSPEDGATYTKWLRGTIILYGGIGLVALAVILAGHFSSVAIQVAGN
jgi:hypothetical protein